MTFLNPTMLIGLVAGAIPVIIHLITRQRARVVPFSTVRFLKELKTQQIRRLKIKQMLLLLLRTLALLLLAFAFAQPTLKGRLGTDLRASAQTSAVIILDNSLSMSLESQGQQLFDLARQRLSELGQVFKPGDEIYGIFASHGTPAIYDGPKYDFKAVAKIIQKASVSHSSTDIIAALHQAQMILQQRQNINKEIYLISDFQQTAFRDSSHIKLPLFHDQGMKLLLIPMAAESVSNLVVTEVKLVNQIIEVGKPVELEVVVKNTGNRAERDKLIQVFLDDKRAGQASISVAPGQTQVARLRVVPQRAGVMAGSVLLEDDDLFADNRRFFTLFVPDQVAVLVIGQQINHARFLQLALNPDLGQATPIKVDFLPPNKIEFGTLKNYQVVALVNLPRIDGTLLNALADHVQAGGGLMVMLGNDVDLRDYNANFNQKLALPVFSGTVGTVGKRTSFLTINKIDFSHPIFAGVFEQPPHEVDSPQFYFATLLKLNPGHHPIIEFSTGDPFLVETKFGSGRVMVFASALDPEWSDLYLKGLFVPLMNRAVMYLSGNAHAAHPSNLVDQPLTAGVSGGIDGTKLLMERPDGKQALVIPQLGDGVFKINYTDTGLPGIYTLYAGNQLLARWPVNPDSAESDFAPIDLAQFAQIIGHDQFLVIQNQESILNAVQASRYGRELWRYFVAAGLLLLIIEMVVARAGNRASEQIASVGAKI